MKKINIEKFLLIFLMILPALDISSFLFRNYFNTSFSPSTFIRPIIPLLLIIFIFFKYKFKLKIFTCAIIYGIYCIFHLYFFSKLNYEISYGTITHELQYLINYTFSIINLFIFLFVFNNNENYKKINKAVLIANGIYILSIYISIFTKTSSSTYLEGQGYKGWFESGNSISSILVLNLFIIFTLFNTLENKYLKVVAIIEIVFSGIFLTFLLGTRTGLFGFALVHAMFIFSKLFEFIKNNTINKTFTKKNKIILIILIFILFLIIFLFILKGSSFLSRRKYLVNLNDDIVDLTTGEPSHVTGDILKFKEQIENELINENFASIEVQKSIIELYNTANKYKLNLTNRRAQQLIFNFYLVKNQHNILYILFGNGFLNNYGELILEMEIPAFLFNFGLIGFVLYFIPFFSLFIYYCYIGIKNIKKLDYEFIFLLSGIILSFVLSFLVGQLFFNSSAMIIIICINVLLFNNCNNLNNKNGNKKIKENSKENKIPVNI